VISHVWEATTSKRMQIDQYCRRQKCSPVNVVSSDIRVTQIFAGVRQIWGVKQESGHLTCQCCRAFTLALAMLSCQSSGTELISRTYIISLPQRQLAALYSIAFLDLLAVLSNRCSNNKLFRKKTKPGHDAG